MTAAALALTMILTPTAANAGVSQKVTVGMGGSCYDNRNYYRQYALWETDGDDCYFWVQTNNAYYQRDVVLQYYDTYDRTWYTEDESYTDEYGYAEVYVEPYACGDLGDEFCDGSWKYRVIVPKYGKLKQVTSKSVPIYFYSGYFY